MSKTVRTVFMVIGTLVFWFIVWQLVVNDGGILKTMYNGMANGINNQWAKVAGSGVELIPLWTSSNADSNGTGFEINTSV